MKKTLVLVTTRFPWPLTNGFASKNYWLIRGLCDKYDIDLHVIQFNEVGSQEAAKVAPYCRSINIYKPNFFDIVFGILRSFFLDYPIQIGLYYSFGAKTSIKKNLESCDVSICSVIRSAQFLGGYIGPVIYDLADSLGQVYLRDATKYRGVKKIVYREEGRRMAKYERSVVGRKGEVVFFNAMESQFYQMPNVSQVPHGVNPALFEITESSSQCSDGVVIFGKMNFEPNVNAVNWFADNVLSLLPESISLYVVGVSPSPSLLKLSLENPRVKVMGFIENPYPLIRGSIASICPIQTGGGIQNKAIESLAVGAITIMSPLAAAAMNDIESGGLIVCDEAIAWAEKIVDISKNPEMYALNRKLGPTYVQDHFSWNAYAAAINDRIECQQNINPLKI